MSERLVLKGSIENTTLPTLLGTLYSNQETGELAFSFLDRKKTIFVKEGHIIFATSTDPDDRLGEYLLRKGIISATQYLESVKHIRPGKRQGAILCELGYLSPENLIESVHNQILAIIFSLFEWSRGTYSMELRELQTQDLIALNLKTEDIIMRGIKRINLWSRLFGAVGPPSTILAKTKNCDLIYYNMDLSEEEIHILSLITGRASVADICNMSYLASFETYKTLWGFIAVGCIERTEQPVEESKENEERLEVVIETYNQMFAHIFGTFFQAKGEYAQDLMIQAIKDVATQYPDLYHHVYVDASGRVDFDQFYNNLLTSATARRYTIALSALNELLYNLIFVVKRELGSETEMQVAEHIKKLKKDIL